VDAVSASAQQISEHFARSEAQRAERNDTSRRRVVLCERELEVRKFELLLGPTSSATEQEKQTARALLLNSLKNMLKTPQTTERVQRRRPYRMRGAEVGGYL
jgi:hypothetical protein